ncbi:hypothetical protein A0H81_01014 [Grifola frondosa]|uniref:Uncharacterized protein n=1 Tax=Grifola frondosa TaxID=5627 RepID=A0A1C7MRD3_GRIFR|nr:hypothetical protein A0H81_01014 [Grifola frondosa]
MEGPHADEFSFLTRRSWYAGEVPVPSEDLKASASLYHSTLPLFPTFLTHPVATGASRQNGTLLPHPWHPVRRNGGWRVYRLGAQLAMKEGRV